MRRRWGRIGAVILIVTATVIAATHRNTLPHNLIDGPYARLLAEASDLGPARSDRVQLTVALRAPSEPVRLNEWARGQGLSVRWQTGDNWAVVEGGPAAMATAFRVSVHDYRIRGGPSAGRVFYASPQQPEVPSATVAEVTGLGRILGYLPHRMVIPPTPPLDVPDGGLLPHQLITAYNAQPLVRAGYTGKGITVAVFGFDGFDQRDLDMFSDLFNLPRFTPEMMGERLGRRGVESTMDLQVIHAVAPGAKLVLVNSLPHGRRARLEERGRLMRWVHARYPPDA